MNNSLEVIAEIPQNELPPELAGFNQYNLNYNSFLGENCNIVSFNGYYYTVQNDTLTSVTVPSNYNTWNKIRSESMTYMMSDFTLYKYSEQSNSYVSIYNLPYANRYEMYNYENRIIVVGASNNWDYMSMTQTITENIYVLIDNNGIISMIDIVTLNFNTYNSWVPITVSPQLTKFYYQYTTMYSSVPTIGVKSVDYVNYYVNDVTIIDEIQFTETVKSLSNSTNNTFSYNTSNTSSCNIKLGDRFFIVRNDTPASNNSTYNTSNSTNSSNVPPVYVE